MAHVMVAVPEGHTVHIHPPGEAIPAPGLHTMVVHPAGAAPGMASVPMQGQALPQGMLPGPQDGALAAMNAAMMKHGDAGKAKAAKKPTKEKFPTPKAEPLKEVTA